MKKIAVIMLALLLVVLGLAGCAQEGGSTSSGETQGDSDLAYVQGKGKLIVGITDFEPMDYVGENGDWIGFDADMAKAFAADLGVDIEFIEITNWDNKSIELDTKAIDVVWNGMTLTNDVKALMGTGEPYCTNTQVAVMKKDKTEQYQTLDSLKELKFAAENGSAGAEALDDLGIPYTAVDTQGKALMEVAAGSADACVIDSLMARAMTGEGTSYADLVVNQELSPEEYEEYGVGFRKGSDLVAAFNEFWKKAYDAGTVMEVAETYGIAENIIAK